MSIVIGVVGNCQSADLARCFEAMLPDARIQTATYRLLLQGTRTVEGTLSGSDLHVMRIFLEHYSTATPRNAVLDAEIQASRSVICEEELLEN